MIKMDDNCIMEGGKEAELEVLGKEGNMEA